MSNFRQHFDDLLYRTIIVAITLGAMVGSSINRIEANGIVAVELGKAKLIELSVTPSVVMLGDPSVADVVIEENGLIFLLGKETGETNLMVFNDKGEVLISSQVVVGPVLKRHVTVDRGDQRSTLSCNPRCVAVATPQGAGAATTAAVTPVSGQTTAAAQPQAVNAAGADANVPSTPSTGQ